MSDPAIRRVATALDQVVTDFGRRAADDPRRLRGLLTDTLGVEASDLHEAVEAIVSAAAGGLPQAILAIEGDVDRSELAATLTGVPDLEDAHQVVDAWMTALRVQDRFPTDSAETQTPPPPRTLHLEPTRLPPSPGSDSEARTERGDDATPDGRSTSWPSRMTTRLGEKRVLVSIAAVVMFLAVSGAGYAALTGREPSGVAEAAVDESTTTTVGKRTTTSTDAGDDTPATLRFPEETMAWGGKVNRSWELAESELAVTLEVSSGDEALTGSVWDVFPPSLAVDVEALELATVTGWLDGRNAEPVDAVRTTYTDDTALRMLLDLEPRSVLTLEYTIPLPTEADDDDYLDRLRDEWETAMAELMAIPAPTVEVTSEVIGSEAVITGTATPGAAVRILGKTVAVTDDGTFEHAVALEPGTNVITGMAVHLVRGNRAEFEVTHEYQPPASTTTTTSPPRSNSPATTTTTAPSQSPATTAPPTTAPPTTAPPPTSPPTTANSAPTPNCGSEYWNLAGYSSSYGIGMYPSCFGDAEGDSFVLNASQPDWGSIGGFSGSCSYGAGACWTYHSYSGWDGTPYEARFTIWATDEHGAQSSPISVTLCVNCG